MLDAAADGISGYSRSFSGASDRRQRPGHGRWSAGKQWQPSPSR
jgi:hypothetical protein